MVHVPFQACWFKLLFHCWLEIPFIESAGFWSTASQKPVSLGFPLGIFFQILFYLFIMLIVDLTYQGC